jgi:hypothetical protein
MRRRWSLSRLSRVTVAGSATVLRESRPGKARIGKGYFPLQQPSHDRAQALRGVASGDYLAVQLRVSEPLIDFPPSNPNDARAKSKAVLPTPFGAGQPELR